MPGFLEYVKSSREEFSRVKKIQWIQSLLDFSHHFYSFSVFSAHVVNFTYPGVPCLPVQVPHIFKARSIKRSFNR